MNVFGLAELKEEGKTLWPITYLMMNNTLPSRSIYTQEELKMQKDQGYCEEWYCD